MTKSIIGKQTDSLIETVTLKSTNSPINTTTIITNTTNATITATQLLSGHILRTGFTASVTDNIGPNASDIVAAIPNCRVGDNFLTTIVSVPSTAITVGSILYTINPGTGMSNRSNIPNVAHTATIGSQLVTYRFVVTNVTSPSIVIHRLANVTQVPGTYT